AFGRSISRRMDVSPTETRYTGNHSQRSSETMRMTRGWVITSGLTSGRVRQNTARSATAQAAPTYHHTRLRTGPKRHPRLNALSIGLPNKAHVSDASRLRQDEGTHPVLSVPLEHDLQIAVPPARLERVSHGRSHQTVGRIPANQIQPIVL